MKLRMTWFLGGCAFALIGGMNAMACSSSSSVPTGPGADSGGGGMDATPGKDGTTPGQDTGPGADVAPGSDTGPVGDAGGDVDCGKKSDLHPEDAAGIYCPFSAVGDGGDKTCTGGEVCCQTPETEAGTPSTCAAAGTTSTTCPVAKSIVWECEDPIDCVGSAGGSLCCGFGVAKKEDPSCTNYDYVSGASGKGSVCADSCTGGNIICETQAECTAADAGTCTPVKYHGNAVGFCM
jgi:hypothetical protein